MTPEATHFLNKAHALLREAEIVAAVDLPNAAGRAAYLTCFHAAQALLFETTGKVFKTHTGVQSEFGRLTKDDPGFDLETRALLGRTYNLKAIADYESGPGSQITPEQAAEAVSGARSFLGKLEGVLGARSERGC